MRIILFRAREMCSYSWVFGYYRHVFITNGLAEGVAYDSHKIFDPKTRIEHDVVPETVGQFTGLKDKNGVEIYEGDILKVQKGKMFPYRCLVKFDFGKFIFDKYELLGSKYVGELDSSWAHYCIIIGNIHENPELLEVRDEN